MKTILIAASGGLDSTTLLWHAASLPDTIVVYAVHFQYGSRHNSFEEVAIRKLKDVLPKNVRFHTHTVSLGEIFSGGRSSLLASPLNEDIPEGHYEEETMRSTVVPGRNLVLIAACASIAEAKGVMEIWLGTHAGDHYIYPDCRLEFIESANETVKRSTLNKVSVLAPYILKSKVDIVKAGIELKVPFELTRTCYKNQPVACGKCGSCQERLEAFRLNDMSDPLPYQSRAILYKKGS